MKKTDSNTFIKQYTLPPEVKNSLKDRLVIETTNGTYTLPPWQGAKMVTLLIGHRHPEEHLLPGDPHLEEKGWYCLTAFPLVSETEAFLDAEEILLWLPAVNLYGCYDTDRQQLYVYPGATWTEIEKELPRYLTMLIDPVNIRCHLRVWEHLDFVPRDFPALANNLLRTPQTDDTLRAAEQLIWHHERPLLNLPFHYELYSQYLALLNLYLHLAWQHTVKPPAEVLAWLDKSWMLMKSLRKYLVLMQ